MKRITALDKLYPAPKDGANGDYYKEYYAWSAYDTKDEAFKQDLVALSKENVGNRWYETITKENASKPYLWVAKVLVDGTSKTWKSITYYRSTGKKGDPGIQGELGPIAYMAGEWISTNTYTRTNDIVPVVHHNDKYWYQKKNGSSKGDEPSDDSSVWRLAQSYDIILAKIIMASFGKIASAIYSGDFMISQYGKHNGVEVNEKSTKTEQDTAYTDFDDEDPDNGRFVPNLYLNFLTGLVRSVKMKAYDMEAHGGTFDNVKVSGTLNGVSGSFKKLSCLDSNGNEVGYISFSSDGRMWFYGDMQQQGADSKEHRAYRFLTNDVWCRGAFGHREKLIAWVCGTYMYVYPKGTDSNGTMITLDSAIIGKQTYYKIPLYSPKYESHSDVAGMPIDVVVFNCSTDYYYNFTGKGNGKEWTVINGNDAKTIHFADIGGWHELQGGHSLRCTYVPQKLLNPQSCKLGSGIGEGIFWTGDTDLNWL